MNQQKIDAAVLASQEIIDKLQYASVASMRSVPCNGHGVLDSGLALDVVAKISSSINKAEDILRCTNWPTEGDYE